MFYFYIVAIFLTSVIFHNPFGHLSIISSVCVVPNSALNSMRLHSTTFCISRAQRRKDKVNFESGFLPLTVPNMTFLEMLFICKVLCQNHSFFPVVWNNFLSEHDSIQRSPHQNCFPLVASIILEKSFHNASYCICVFPAIRQLVIAIFFSNEQSWSYFILAGCGYGAQGKLVTSHFLL